MRSAIGSSEGAGLAAGGETGALACGAIGSGGEMAKPKSKSKLSVADEAWAAATIGAAGAAAGRAGGAGKTGAASALAGGANTASNSAIGSSAADAGVDAAGGGKEGADTGGAEGPGAGAGRDGSATAAGIGRDATGFGISRSCQLDIGSGLKVDAAGNVPKSIEAAGFTAVGATGGATDTGAGVAATGAETGASMPGILNTLGAGAGEGLAAAGGVAVPGATGASMPGIRTGDGAGDGAWAVAVSGSVTSFGAGLASGSDDSALVAINLASSAIKSSDFSWPSGICCGLAVIESSAPVLVDPSASYAPHTSGPATLPTNAPEL